MSAGAEKGDAAGGNGAGSEAVTEVQAPAQTAGAAGDVVATAPAVPPVDPALAARRAGRRELTVTVLIALLGGVIAWAAAGRSWAAATVGEAPSTLKVSASGSDLSGALTALALTGLAGALALLATQRLARRLVGVLLMAAGIGLAGYAFGERGTTHAARVLADKAATKGVASGTVVAHMASWWVLAALGGVLVVLAGVAAVVRGATWPGMSSRYENAASKSAVSKTAAVAADTGSSKDLWDALDRGEDPTERAEAAESGPAAGSAGAEVASLTSTPGTGH